MPSMKDWAVTTSPLENVVPERRRKVHWEHAPSWLHFSATPGTSSDVARSTLTKPSNRALVTFVPSNLVTFSTSDSWEL